MKTLLSRLNAQPASHPADAGAALMTMCRCGLSDLQRFILISAAFFMVRDFNLYAAFPEEVLQVLGCPPPPQLVLIALAGYVFTVVTPLLIHLSNGDRPATSRWHLLYRSTFYLFFLCSHTLDSYFMLVLGIGLLLYLLEQTCVGVSLHRLGHRNGHPA